MVKQFYRVIVDEAQVLRNRRTRMCPWICYLNVVNQRCNRCFQSFDRADGYVPLVPHRVSDVTMAGSTCCLQNLTLRQNADHEHAGRRIWLYPLPPN